MANLKSLIVNGTARFFGTVYGVFNGSFTGNLAGKSTSSDKVNLLDTRNVNSLPSYYQGLGMGVYEEFKDLSVLGISGAGQFGTLSTFCSWKDSTGGLPYQELICSKAGTLRKFRRIATSVSEWGAWEELDYAYRDLSNIPNKRICHVVVESYKNGNSWWRLWDDNWLEQGGKCNATQYNTTKVNVTFLKEFADTTYTAMANPNTPDHQGTWDISARCAVLTTKNMCVHGSNNAGSAYTGVCSWYACGMKKV